ncbi:OmpA family protein [Actinomadura rupiterrae]|uniref:OmpA family protein n=1 Tax=Actinomadura rupiterrae TaxID=559627 RepID=UPI0020A5C738|nr:OmpA family protein [Actinomadura rupiterrae]MCP2336648.1 outer membrane protein OmpA-like peptidoglycan-associated protein [Actinomadura rupiterrae]
MTVTIVLGILLLAAPSNASAATPTSAAIGGRSPSPSPSASPVPDGELAKSVLDVNANASVFDIDIAKSVSPLESEQAQGSKVTVSLSADVMFDFDQATLTDAARGSLTRLAARLRNASGTIQVGGHSDALGEDAYNLTLSQKRADVVAAELRRLIGGKADITAKGYGSSRPVAPNTANGKDNPDGRAKNRRVEITFEPA